MPLPFSVPGCCIGAATATASFPKLDKVNPKCRQSDSVPCFTVETAKAKQQD